MDESVPTVDLPGSPLAVRVAGYRVLAELGRGGMAVVYRALQESTDREVALKVLERGGPDHAEAVERFVREAMHAASLRHPGIVPIHDAGVFDDICYLSMELVEGPALDALLDTLRERSPQSLKESFHVETGLDQVWPEAAVGVAELGYAKSCAAWIANVADAVQAAHNAGVIHRDLKPANIMVRGDGQPVVVDFGLSRAVGDPSLTRSGETVGTPAYMAPEQATGSPDLDGRVDVWALAAILYEMLTLRPPIAGTDAAEVMRRVVHEGPPPVAAIQPELPFGLTTVVDCALHSDPDRRYEDPAEFAEDLRRFVAGERTHAETFRRSIKARMLTARDGLAVVSARHPWAWLTCTASICIASLILLLSGGVRFGASDADLTGSPELVSVGNPRGNRAASRSSSANASESDLDPSDAVFAQGGFIQWRFRDPATASLVTLEVLQADGSGRIESFVPVELSAGSIVEDLPPGRHVFRVSVPQIAPSPLVETGVPHRLIRAWIRVVNVPATGAVEVQVPRLHEGDAWASSLVVDGFMPTASVFASEDARFGFDLETMELSAARFRDLFANVLDPELREDLLPASQRTLGQPSEFAGGEASEDSNSVPVSGISYRRARLLAALAGAHLPSAQEWEAGARGGLPPWRFPWGSADGTNGSVGFSERLACDPRGLSGPVVVDALPQSASPMGVFHLVGNVAEWLGGASEPVLAGGGIATPPSRASMFMREHGPGDGDWRGRAPSHAGLRLSRYVTFPEPEPIKLRDALASEHVAWQLEPTGLVRGDLRKPVGDARMLQRGDVIALTLPRTAADQAGLPVTLQLPPGIVIVDASPKPQLVQPAVDGTTVLWSPNDHASGASLLLRADRLLTKAWISTRRVKPVLDGFFAALARGSSERMLNHLHPEHAVDAEWLSRLKVLDLRLQDVVTLGDDVVATVLGTRRMTDQSGIERTVSRWPLVVRLRRAGTTNDQSLKVVAIEPGRWLGEPGFSVLDRDAASRWSIARGASAFVPLQLTVVDPNVPDTVVQIAGIRPTHAAVHLAAAASELETAGALEELLSAGDVSAANGEVWPGPKLASVAMPDLKAERLHPAARHFMFATKAGFAREEWVRVDLSDWHLLIRLVGRGENRTAADLRHKLSRGFFREVATALCDPASWQER